MDLRLQTILQHAIMAPSGDNCQPWKFLVKDMVIDLYNVPDRDTSLYNLKQRASLISHGALLENIHIAAPHVGLRSNVDLFPDPEKPDHVARIDFTEVETREEPSPYFQVISERHTNREKYLPVNISDNQIKVWQELAQRDGEKIWLCCQKKQIADLASLLSLNDRLVFEVPELHRFLFEQIRWSDNDAIKTGDGLDIKTLGLNAMDKVAFHFLKHHGLVAALNKVGFSRIIQMKAGQLLKTASAIVILAIPSSTPQDYVQGGQLWQRLLLQFASEGLTAQPIAGLACLMQAADEGLLAGKVSKVQRDLLNQTRGELLKIAGCDQSVPLLAMFRIGKGAQVTRALRMPLETFLLN